MLRYLSCFKRCKLNTILILLLLYLVVVLYINFYSSQIGEIDLLFPRSVISSTIRTHDFRLYPESRSAVEFNRIKIDNNAESMFIYNENETDKTIDFSKPLQYSETIFRSASFPVIWLDQQGDVRWNRIAQYEMLNYLLEKQYPKDDISTCLSRQLFILSQWVMGFFSRQHCFIEQFGQTLYSPSMVLLAPQRILAASAANDDFKGEGILRYYQPFSLCSSYINHPQYKKLYNILQSFVFGPFPTNTTVIDNISQILERDEKTIRYKYSQEKWKFGYDHVPHRRWLFDRNRKEIQKLLTYNHLSTELLIDHSNEHIYYYNSTSLNTTSWRARNYPEGLPRDVLNGTTTNLTMHDRIFTSFLRYMFLLFFSPFAPRIQTLSKLLAHHWSEYLSDKYKQPYKKALSKMAAMYIRRGDKSVEDLFYKQHGHYRNISMYVKSMINQEISRQINYTTLFITTDDLSVINLIQEYARDGLKIGCTDELYARKYLHGRQILYNIFDTNIRFDSYARANFDQFLVNIQFITDYSSLVISHTSSNVGRYIEELIYVKRQHKKYAQTRKYVINAVNSLD